MASLREKYGSPYWFACFSLSDGTRTQRSTRVPIAGLAQPEIKPLKDFLRKSLGFEIKMEEKTQPNAILSTRDARRLAQHIADQFEDAAKGGRRLGLTEQQARKTISDIYERVNGEKLASSTIKDHFETWLRNKGLEANASTHDRYDAVVKDLFAFLGERVTRDISQLTAKEIAGFRDYLAGKVAISTANLSLKIVRIALTSARRDGLVMANEADKVKTLKRASDPGRRAFTLPELKLLLDNANEEWRGLILCGLYTGQRLGDVAGWTWSNIDLQQKQIRFITIKTGRSMVLPLAKPLLSYLEALPAGDNPEAPLFPNANGKRVGTLSNAFYRIMETSGLVPARTHRAYAGSGRDAKRATSAISFHSLRHSATSFLKDAGASDVVARDIIGHESEAVSRNYTHLDESTKRAAIDKLPDITEQAHQ